MSTAIQYAKESGIEALKDALPCVYADMEQEEIERYFEIMVEVEK